MPAIPIIGLGISAYSAYKQAQAQKQQADLQKQMQQQQFGLANNLQSFAGNQMSMAEPALSKAMSHYTQLATGNRGAIGAEIAPGLNALTESYRGAEKGLDRATAAGPARDRAIADMYRSKAGQAGMMPFQAQQNAYTQLGNMGQHGVENAIQGYQGAASALTGASNTGMRANDLSNQQYNTYGNLINSGVQAGQSAWDWYKKRSAGSGGAGVPGLPGGTGGYF